MGNLGTRNTLDRELRKLQDDVLRLSNLTDVAIEGCLKALLERDDNVARQIITDDHTINLMRYEVEEECNNLIARQQPMASDLRKIITAIHIVVELERIADYAAGVAKLSLEINKEPTLKPYIDLPRMAEIAREMLTEAVDAYLTQDEKKANEILKRDDEVDLLNNQVYRELISYMIEDPRNISRATYLLWVSHNFERMADRITNICERVHYMVTGELHREIH